MKKYPFQTGRRNFQYIRSWYRIFNIQKHADMPAHICTLVNSHSAAGIQKDPQLAPLGAGWDLYAPQSESQGGDNWFDETDETIVLSHLFKSKKKWTIRPTPFGCTLLERSGAGDGDRTRDTKLGKLVLYQLSYTRSTNELYGMYHSICQPRQGARPGPFGSQVSALPSAHLKYLLPQSGQKESNYNGLIKDVTGYKEGWG